VNLSLAVTLVKLILALMSFFERQVWFQQGKAAADAEANAEEKRRIDMANAARADADEFASGGVLDPRQRD
jgi:hypothetical protein